MLINEILLIHRFDGLPGAEIPCCPGMTNIVLMVCSLVPIETAVASNPGSYPAKNPLLHTTAGIGISFLCLIDGSTTKWSSPSLPSVDESEQSV